MLGPLLWWVIGLGIIASATKKTKVEPFPATTVPPKRKEKLPKRKEKPPKRKEKTVPTLQPYGVGEYWEPAYVKLAGCENFRFGACFEDWIDLVAAKSRPTADIEEAKDFIIKILAFFSSEVKVAKWILDHSCIRFKFPLETVEDEWGGRGRAVWRGGDTGYIGPAPSHPFSPRDGWKRVWVHLPGDETNSIRSKNVATVLFLTDTIWEILWDGQIRDLLSMRSEDGALTPKDLAGAACGKVTFWMTLRRGKAREEFQ